MVACPTTGVLRRGYEQEEGQKVIKVGRGMDKLHGGYDVGEYGRSRGIMMVTRTEISTGACRRINALFHARTSCRFPSRGLAVPATGSERAQFGIGITVE